MKVFRKKKREIIIDGHAFSWIVNETATHVKVRCYSLKSTYIEVIFNWGIATWAINFYQPSVATVYKGNIIKNLIMDCHLTQSTAQTRLRAVFLYHGGERRNFPRGLD